jgi:monoamine oxidase
VAAYRRTLEQKDVTTASAQHSRMMFAFDALRDLVGGWPDGASQAGSSAALATGGRDAMDEAIRAT